MTHATAPRSACTFARARPTMSSIRPVKYDRGVVQGGARKHGKAVPYSSCNCQVVPRVHAYRYTVVGLVIEVPRVFKFKQRQKSQGN